MVQYLYYVFYLFLPFNKKKKHTNKDLIINYQHARSHMHTTAEFQTTKMFGNYIALPFLCRFLGETREDFFQDKPKYEMYSFDFIYLSIY